MVEIRGIAGNAGLAETAGVRRVVFIEEQHVPESLEWDGADAGAHHYVATVDGRAVGVARLLVETLAGTAKIQRVAVLREHRRKGLGTQLMNAILDDVWRAGVRTTLLDAQLDVVDFYRALGFEVSGNEFWDAGIRHVRMELSIPTTGARPTADFDVSITVATQRSDLVEMAALDAVLFGGHQALCYADLRRIRAHGLLLQARDRKGAMVGEAQIVFAAILDAKETLVAALPPAAAYLEGYAVHRSHRGCGLGATLITAALGRAAERGKREVWATVRVENVASLRLLLSAGFVVIAYSDRYYDEPHLRGARLVLWCTLLPPRRPTTPTPAARTQAREVTIRSGDAVDSVAHRAVAVALEEMFVGVAYDPTRSALQMLPVGEISHDLSRPMRFFHALDAHASPEA